MKLDLLLAVGHMRAMARSVTRTADAILADLPWLSEERSQERICALLRQAEQALANVAGAVEEPRNPEDFMFQNLSAAEPPADHPVREFGPVLRPMP